VLLEGWRAPRWCFAAFTRVRVLRCLALPIGSDDTPRSGMTRSPFAQKSAAEMTSVPRWRKLCLSNASVRED
jgi:hypothetical protein